MVDIIWREAKDPGACCLVWYSNIGDTGIYKDTVL